MRFSLVLETISFYHFSKLTEFLADICFTTKMPENDAMKIEESYYGNQHLNFHFPGLNDKELLRVNKILAESLGDQLFKKKLVIVV